MDKIAKIREARTGLAAEKWIAEDDKSLPFWVADMDFKSPAFIEEALTKRAAANYYGYTEINPEVKQGIADWFKLRHDLEVNPADVFVANGVKSSYAAIVGRFMEPESAAILMTPLYPPLTKIIKDLGHDVFESQLTCANDRYEIDFANLEEQLKTHGEISTLILCNPHNPVGRAWTVDELTKVAQLANKYNLLVIADEIHAGLTFNPTEFHSFYEVADLAEFKDYFVLNSPAKVFNIAGLKASFVMSKNTNLLDKLAQYEKTYGMDQLSLFAIVGLEAVYLNVAAANDWVDQLMAQLKTNYELLESTLANNPKFEVTKLDATYLAWIKINDLQCPDSKVAKDVLKDEFGVDINDVLAYAGDGSIFIRFNFACPQEMLQVGLDCLIEAANQKRI